MGSDALLSKSGLAPRISGWRLIFLLLLATVALGATASAFCEFFLEKEIYAFYGWSYGESLSVQLRYVAQAAAFTGVALIGPAILLFRSIDQLRRTHVQLIAALYVAESANVAKTQFLANMSHELRTPLNAVIEFSDLMESEPYGPILPRYKSYVADIRSAGLHLLDVINDVLDISKAEAASLHVHISNVALSDILSEVETLTCGFAKDSSITAYFEPEIGANPLVVSADRTRLKQVLLNLVSNAIKFNSIGGTVNVRAYRVASCAYIEIRDTGIGMKPEEIVDAFRPFVQLDTGMARKYQGTGLGLPLTKTLVEAMQGSIAVQSEIDVGSCITITVPIGAQDMQQVPPRRFSGATRGAPAGGARHRPPSLVCDSDLYSVGVIAGSWSGLRWDTAVNSICLHRAAASRRHRVACHRVTPGLRECGIAIQRIAKCRACTGGH